MSQRTARVCELSWLWLKLMMSVYGVRTVIKKNSNEQENCDSESDKRTERHLRFFVFRDRYVNVRFIFPPIDICIYIHIFKNGNDAKEKKNPGKKFEKNNSKNNSVASSKSVSLVRYIEWTEDIS